MLHLICNVSGQFINGFPMGMTRTLSPGTDELCYYCTLPQVMKPTTWPAGSSTKLTTPPAACRPTKLTTGQAGSPTKLTTRRACPRGRQAHPRSSPHRRLACPRSSPRGWLAHVAILPAHKAHHRPAGSPTKLTTRRASSLTQMLYFKGKSTGKPLGRRGGKGTRENKLGGSISNCLSKQWEKHKIQEIQEVIK